jgi:hypothetical protein
MGTVTITQNIETLMRTPVSVFLDNLVGTISFTDPCLGTLLGVTGGTALGTSSVFYVPDIRVPRWPELEAYDAFTFSGVDGTGQQTIVRVSVCILASSPNDRYIGLQRPTGSTTNIVGIVATPAPTGPTGTFLVTAAGGSFSNQLATNNVDGIVFSRASTTSIFYWDPVSGVTGTIDLSVIAGFDPSRPLGGIIAGGGFDNDRVALLLMNSTAGFTGAYYYRITFLPYQTGTVPIIKTMDIITLYEDNALTVPFTIPIADVAWDPNSKRLYISSFDTTAVFYAFPYDMRWNTSGLALQVFEQGATGATGEFPEITFTNDGTVLYAQTEILNNIYTVDVQPIVATFTFVGTFSGGRVVDVATWPATLIAL